MAKHGNEKWPNMGMTCITQFILITLPKIDNTIILSIITHLNLLIMLTEYLPRILDSFIEERLKSIGAILIEGPKWCGKSTTGANFSKRTLYLSDPIIKGQLELILSDNSEILSEGDFPLLIDEWQEIPILWDLVRNIIDRKGIPGEFILTGSAKPADRSKISHSGTGRFAWIKMRPMSLWESGDSSGTVSLKKLFDDNSIPVFGQNDLDLTRIAYLVCRGGWPQSIKLPENVSLNVAEDYYEALVNVDISNVDGTSRDIATARRIMRSYARFQGTQTPTAQILKDISSNSSVEDIKTVNSYLGALRNLFVIEDMPAWNPNLKSRTAIRTSDTRYFIDPSIAAAALAIGPGDLLNDLKLFGFMFETLAVRDLRIYAQSLKGDVYHFRDKNGLECDAVIHLHNGNYGLVEIKLGGEGKIEEGAESLKDLSKKIDYEKMPKPAFMMILTAVGKFAYRRPDGILVVPIGVLRN